MTNCSEPSDKLEFMNSYVFVHDPTGDSCLYCY
jgi:hypothetical protein